MTRAELKAKARDALSGNWGVAIAAWLALSVFSIALSVISSQYQLSLYTLLNGGTYSGLPLHVLERIETVLSLVLFIITGPLNLGIAIVYSGIVCGERVEYREILDGFSSFKRAFFAMLTIGVFSLLWSLLLVIPGIIAGLSYSQTYYILNDNPNMTGNQARKASVAMMKGHKWEYFVLRLSFLPWTLLCALVIPAFYVAPYMEATMAAYYQHLKEAQTGVS